MNYAIHVDFHGDGYHVLDATTHTFLYSGSLSDCRVFAVMFLSDDQTEKMDFLSKTLRRLDVLEEQLTTLHIVANSVQQLEKKVQGLGG